eukprot:403353724
MYTKLLFQYFIIGQYLLISEQLMVAFLMSSVMSFILVANTRGRAQIYILSIWLFLMFYFLLIHMLIKDYLPKYLEVRLAQPRKNFFVKFVMKRCIEMYKKRVQSLNRSFQSLSDLQQRNEVNSVDYILRLNLLVIQFLTQDFPSHMHVIIRHHRREMRNRVNRRQDNQQHQNIQQQFIQQNLMNLQDADNLNLNHVNNPISSHILFGRPINFSEENNDLDIEDEDLMYDTRMITQIMLRMRRSLQLSRDVNFVGFRQGQRMRQQNVAQAQNYEREGLSSIELLRLQSEKYQVNTDLEESESCCICLDNFTQDQFVRRLGCKHMFHKTCLDKWLIRCGACPLCKTNIVAQDLQQN